uniref:Zinc-finger domain-containing protein n=1 Tax=mine drainage metagenome TaxID=410659 RepID=E6Q031_9ZZZZ
MTCGMVHSMLPEMLFGSSSMDSAVESHLAECSSCQQQFSDLRQTINLLDGWTVPEPNPYFMTHFETRLSEEWNAPRAGWLARTIDHLRARVVYGSRWKMQPVAAMAMSVLLLVGGGAYLGLNTWRQAQPAVITTTPAVVHDLQNLDSNAQALDQLENLSGQED